MRMVLSVVPLLYGGQFEPSLRLTQVARVARRVYLILSRLVKVYKLVVGAEWALLTSFGNELRFRIWAMTIGAKTALAAYLGG